jgi:eukaryotic-like serine/threonine-protein kinase
MDKTPGQVITFYSYRGGSGRSMALANTACVLAKSGKKVLVVDWDWQSPSQHCIFAPLVTKYFAASADPKKSLDQHIGLIELLSQLALNVQPFVFQSDAGKDEMDATLAFVQESYIEHCVIPTDIEGLSLMKCGSFPDFYNRAMRFDWEDLWSRSAWLLWAFAQRLAADYDYVLIDSTSGLGDTAVVCNAIMPDKIVFVASPSGGNLEGGIRILKQAGHYRRNSSDLRPLQIFPLPSLTDNRESDLRTRFLSGCQTEFRGLFADIYAMPDCQLMPYLYYVEVPFFPWASYSDEIAVLKPSETGVNSLGGAYRRFVERLTSGKLPWEQ